MYSSRQCKNLTYLCGTANDPSQESQYRAENGNLRKSGLHLAMVPCLHQSNVYIKRKLWVWRVKKSIPLVGAKTSLTRPGQQTTTYQASQCSADNGNLRKYGFAFCHGTVFAPKQYLYQKEATGMESPKIYSSSRCKNLNYLWGTSNDPISRKPV